MSVGKKSPEDEWLDTIDKNQKERFLKDYCKDLELSSLNLPFPLSSTKAAEIVLDLVSKPNKLKKVLGRGDQPLREKDDLIIYRPAGEWGPFFFTEKVQPSF